MKWIKIEDRKPRCCDEILFCEDGKTRAGWLETYVPLEELCFWDALRKEGCYSVTHWMPLPKPPEKHALD